MKARHYLNRNLYRKIMYIVALCWAVMPNIVYGVELINFDDFYGKTGVLGFEFSEKVKQLTGQRVKIKGFMAPPLKAESQFFVLTKMPMALCPFCSTDADWPEDILVVYLDTRQTFVQNNQQIEVEGTLEHGTWRDPDTGFVSLLRLRNAKFNRL